MGRDRADRMHWRPYHAMSEWLDAGLFPQAGKAYESIPLYDLGRMFSPCTLSSYPCSAMHIDTRFCNALRHKPSGHRPGFLAISKFNAAAGELFRKHPRCFRLLGSHGLKVFQRFSDRHHYSDDGQSDRSHQRRGNHPRYRGVGSSRSG